MTSLNNNNDDLTCIIKNMAMEYLKPKHPIYRLDYINSQSNEEEYGSSVSTSINSIVVEVIDGANAGASHYWSHTPENSGVTLKGNAFWMNGRIDTKLLPYLLKKKGGVMESIDHDQTWVFTEIERIG